MAAGDLTTIEDVKAWAGITGINADDKLARLVTAASRWIEIITGRKFAATACSEIRNGSGRTELFLADGPVIAVTSLTIDAVSIPAQPADGQRGYFVVDQRIIALEGYSFTRGSRNVRVSYTAGYSTIPGDIAQACVELVASAFRRGSRVDQQTVSLSTPGGAVETATFTTAALSDASQRAIQNYTKVTAV